MNDKEFFDFTYEEYKTELALAHSLYQKVGIMLTAVVAIGGAATVVGRPDLLSKSSERFDVAVLHVMCGIVFLSLCGAVIYLFCALWPRTYPKINKPFYWQQWRKSYWADLEVDDPNDVDRNRKALADATLECLQGRLADAQAVAAYMNQRRMRAFHGGAFCLAIAVGALALESVLALVLKLRGV